MRAATPADIDTLATVLARAFHDDPILGWLIGPRAHRRHARLRRFFALELAHVTLPNGEVIATDATDGALLLLPPERWRLPLTTQAAHAPGFARVFGPRLAQALALITVMEQRHPREPHNYIPFVGIDPASSGQGLGTELLTTVTDRSDAQRLPVYLEATSESNRRLYLRHGFAQTGEIRALSSPPLWPMWRAPR